jgi:hypothetical protein
MSTALREGRTCVPCALSLGYDGRVHVTLGGSPPGKSQFAGCSGVPISGTELENTGWVGSCRQQPAEGGWHDDQVKTERAPSQPVRCRMGPPARKSNLQRNPLQLVGQ